MIKVQSITVERVEGYDVDLITLTRDGDNAIDLAQSAMSKWNRPALGYNKCYVTVTWEDNISYHFRYDLTKEHVWLSKHMMERAEYHCLTKYPAWMEEKDRESAKRYIEDCKRRNPKLFAMYEEIVNGKRLVSFPRKVLA